MRYFSAYEILRAIACSSILGAIAGCVYSALSTLFSCIWRLLCIVLTVFSSTKPNQCIAHASLSKRHSGIASLIFDIIFFVGYGVAHILACYVTMDGIPRIYVIIPSIAIFFVSKNTMGEMFERLIVCLYTAIYCIAFVAVFLITYPLRILWRISKRLMTPPILYTVHLIVTLLNERLMKKKEKQIRAFFASA